jgi:PAS domain S-box-containing protein
MKKINLRLSHKLLLGFGVVIFIFAINVSLSVYTLIRSKEIITNNSEVIAPSLSSINSFILMVSNAKAYTTNWVYVQNDAQGKQSLRQIHTIEYPVLSNKIRQLMANWENPEQVAKMDTLLTDFERLMAVQQEIMESLASFDDYQDFLKTSEATLAIDDKILPLSNMLIEKLNKLAEQKRKEVVEAEAKLMASFNLLQWIIIGLGIAIVVAATVAALLTTNAITKPLKEIKNIIYELSKGILPDTTNNTYNQDEIGEMGMAVEVLVDGLKTTAVFAENIGQGYLDAPFKPLSERDVLGNALLAMRESLKKVADEDRKRSWATEGIAQFSEMLRQNNNDITKLAEEIITSLVKYLKANQGAIFIVQDELDDEEPYLEMKGCYAWDRKKYLQLRIYKGEGLAGQAWQEGDSIYLTDVPENYVMIASGLGESNPTSILIVPLKVNEQIFGIVELASFDEFPEYQRDFVAKIGESIASTISMVKVNEKTTRLLQESQIMTEQMQAQEEEMRQNMEELQATQEEMERNQNIIRQREGILDATNLVVEISEMLSIIQANEKLCKTLGYDIEELEGAKFSKILIENNTLDAIKNALTQHTYWTGIVQMKSKKGQIITVKAAGGTLEEQDNTRFLLIMSDVTELVAVA